MLAAIALADVQSSPRMLFKLTVLGDGGVGKTALTVQVSPSTLRNVYTRSELTSAVHNVVVR
jgi:GTPase SAR1 family protein